MVKVQDADRFIRHPCTKFGLNRSKIIKAINIIMTITKVYAATVSDQAISTFHCRRDKTRPINIVSSTKCLKRQVLRITFDNFLFYISFCFTLIGNRKDED